MIVTVECACGALLVYDHWAGKRKSRCESCRREAARRRARAHHHAQSLERRRQTRAAWREANRTVQRQSAREWAARNRASVSSNTQNYRARKLQAFVEPVDRDIVYVLHDGICGVCGQMVDCRDFEVDHVVPLSKGGKHGYANTQPAHPLCNRRKNGRLGVVA